MSTTDESIRRHESRAAKATLVAASTAKARAELALALLNAESGALPGHVVGAIGDAIEIITNAAQDAERFRLRQLRKADQKEHAHG